MASLRTGMIGDIMSAIIGLVIFFAVLPSMVSAINTVTQSIGSFGAVFGMFMFATLGFTMYKLFTLDSRVSLGSLIMLIIVLNLLATGSAEIVKYVNGYDADGDGLYNGTNDIPPLQINGAGATLLQMFVNLLVGTGIGMFLLVYAFIEKLGVFNGSELDLI